MKTSELKYQADNTGSRSRALTWGRGVAAFVIFFMVSGCMGVTPGRVAVEDAGLAAHAAGQDIPAPAGQTSQEAVPAGPVAEKSDKKQPAPVKEPRLKRIVKPKKEGKSPFFLLGGGKKPKGEKTRVELAFDNADLYEVLDVSLFELFGISYMVDPSIKAKVTFHLAGEYTKDEFVNIVNDVLQLNNLAVTRGPGNIYKVVRRTASSGVTNALITKKGEEAAGDIIRKIRLKYLSAATAAKNIKPFLSKGATVIRDGVTNSLVIGDSADNIEKAAGIIGSMDLPYFKEISWQIFPLTDVTVGDMSKDIKGILKNGGPLKPTGIVKGSFEIFPIKTMNALLVVTRWPEMLRMVEDWIRALDRPSGLGTNVYVYFVENGSAVELVDILKQLYGGKKSDKKKVAVVKPTAGSKAAGRSSVTGELSGDVEIIPDESNNAIVFKATESDYRLIKTVLNQLDILPRQVLIKVMVAEVSLTNELKYGVQWLLEGSHGGSNITGGSFENITTDITRGFAESLSEASGFAGVLERGGDLMGVIKALESDTDLKILSSPNVLALDNKEAVIEVTDETPVETGKVTSSEATTTTSTIEFKKTGIILKVTPHINSSGLVKMELDQEVSTLGEFNQDLNNFTFLVRKAVTSLVVEDGQTILLGGLMKTNINNSDSGIPLLKNIPYLGKLFSATDERTQNTELLFFITPRVIHSRSDADIITREFSETVNGVMDLIDTSENHRDKERTGVN